MRRRDSLSAPRTRRGEVPWPVLLGTAAAAVAAVIYFALRPPRPDRPPATLAGRCVLIRSGEPGGRGSGSFDFALYGPMRARFDVIAVAGEDAKSIAHCDLLRSADDFLNSPGRWTGWRVTALTEEAEGEPETFLYEPPGTPAPAGPQWAVRLAKEAFDLDRAGSRDSDPPNDYFDGAPPDGWARGHRIGARSTRPAWSDGAGGGGSITSGPRRLPAGAVPRSWGRRLVGAVPPGTLLDDPPPPAEWAKITADRRGEKKDRPPGGDGRVGGAVLGVVRLDAPAPPPPLDEYGFEEMNGDEPDPPDAFDDLDLTALTPQALIDWNRGRVEGGEEPVAAVFHVLRWRPARPEDVAGEEQGGYSVPIDDLPCVAATEARRTARWRAKTAEREAESGAKAD